MTRADDEVQAQAQVQVQVHDARDAEGVKVVRTSVSWSVFIGFSLDTYVHIHQHSIRSGYGVRAKLHIIFDEYDGDMVALNDHIHAILDLRRHNMVRNINRPAQVASIVISIVTKLCFKESSKGKSRNSRGA